MAMLIMIDITFYANTEYADTAALLKAQHSSLNYVEHMKDRLRLEVIKHIGNKKTRVGEHPGFRFFPGKNGFFHIPFYTLRYVKKCDPDIVLVQGVIFPFQLMVMRGFLGKKAKIIAMHQADYPPHGLKKLFQKLADRCTDAYLFTSYGNAKEWLDTGMINNREKVYEVPATLTGFSKLNKETARRKLFMDGGPHYLWVGRLNANKDPMTILAGFEKYASVAPGAKLHMIYQWDELLPQVRAYIELHPVLQNTVLLHGYVAYDDLPVWYSAADFYISGSHREGGSAGLLEAMACGCIPIVTSIAPAMKVICNGKYGFYFEPGNVREFTGRLFASAVVNRQDFSGEIESHFTKEYSLAAVTERLFGICRKLTGK